MVTPAQNRPERQAVRSPLPGWARVALRLVIALHLTAVIAAPWSMPPPASYLSQVVAQPFVPYLQATNMFQGYRFFGPDPGPSHLVRYRLEMPDGSQREGMFPNLREQWPRLLYHRYFMLSEHLVDALRPEGPTTTPPTPADLRPAGQGPGQGVRRRVAAAQRREAGHDRAGRARDSLARGRACRPQAQRSGRLQNDVRPGQLFRSRAGERQAMRVVLDYLRDLIRATRDGWDQFWFTPMDPATLGIIRILAGAMLLYTHLVWSLDLPAFFSSQGWLTPEALASDPQSYTRFNWSHFYLIHSSPRCGRCTSWRWLALRC